MSEFYPGDQFDMDNIICPHCGASRKADSRDGDACQDESYEECCGCRREFIRYATISVTYHTRKP